MTNTSTRLKPLLTLLVGGLSALGGLSLAHVGPAQAQSPGVNLATLAAQVNSLTSQVSTLTTKLNADEGMIASQGNTIGSQAGQIGTLQNTVRSQQGQISTLQSTASSQGTSLGRLQTLTGLLTLSGTDLTFTGVNVHVVSGKGSTDDGTLDQFGDTIPGKPLSGLGNLIIGYNMFGYGGGSHNLILGDGNSYSSYGGLVAGSQNAVSGPYASVTGGSGNTASGIVSSVSGGNDNTASQQSASVSGGVAVSQNNTSGWSGGRYHSP